MKIRIGNGFDFHRLAKSEKPLVLCGLEIDSEYSIVAHSDGDIIIHTVVDAILGGLNAGDIGTLFPDSDPKWKTPLQCNFLKQLWVLWKQKSSKFQTSTSQLCANFQKLNHFVIFWLKTLQKL